MAGQQLIQLDRLTDTLLAPLGCYDLVVFDGTTAGRDRLTLALAGRSDVTLLVVQAGSGQKTLVEEAAHMLSAASGAPGQIVLVRP